MPRGQPKKMNGPICNVLIDIIDTATSLPRIVDNNSIILVKLKRKLEYNGHVYFESVSRQFINDLLHYLKINNQLYRDISLNIENIPRNLLSIDDTGDANEHSDIIYETLISSIDNPIPIQIEDEQELELSENPLDEYRTASNETLLITNIPQPVSNDICINITPGEGKQPKPVLSDEFSEELAHPYLFPTGKFGYKVKRNVTLSPVKYFNQRFLNYTQKIASDSDYIFFVHSILQQLALQSQINVAVRKVTSASLNAVMINKKFKQCVQQFVANDQAYTFMC